MTTLQYSALDVGKPEIRLLDIAPGDGDDEICCSLSVVSLSSHPQFEALSYIWGDPSITKDVTVDGASHPVTLNLESALRDLRYPSKTRTIWADAICINQADGIEKNHQVPLMGDIYRKASGVVAYLGHSNLYLEHLVDWLYEDWLYEDSRKWPLLSPGRWTSMTLRSWISQKSEREKDLLGLKTSLGLLEFVSHQYFSRMWTFQEYLLPSRRPVFVVGKKSFEMGDFSLESWQKLNQRHFDAACKAGKRLLEAIEPEAQELGRLFQARWAHILVDDSLRVQKSVIGEVLARPRDVDMFNLFYMTRHRKSSNPRDKIFSLHALVQELVPGICVPDYGKSVDKVLLETLSKLYQYDPSLIRRFMDEWPLRPSSVEYASSPSWLPDITATDSPFFMCDEPVAIPLRISEDFLILTLGARSIGKYHPSLIRLGSEPEEILRRIAGLMYSNGEDLHSFAPSKITMRRNLSERIFYAVWVCAPMLQKSEYTQVQLSIFSTIEKYKGIGNFDDIPFTAEQEYFLPAVVFAAKNFANKAFFWMDTGLFGVCSERLQEGDTIMITSELGHPFAVRTRLDPSGESNHYCMVGWVYIDGLNGASMDTQVVNKIQETPLSDIYIH